jgi:HSP20 family molecular chaperone IbpA
MKAEAVAVKNTQTPEKARAMIFDEMRRDFAEWMDAKEDRVCRPAIELERENNEFAVRTLVPDVDPRDVEILVSPERILIKGKAHRGEPDEKNVMCSVAFPQPVRMNKVHAEMMNGMLSVWAGIAGVSGFMPRAA